MSIEKAGTPDNLQQVVNAHRAGIVGFTGNVGQRTAGVQGSAGGNGAVPFADILQSKMDGLKFSAHAANRIKSRNIDLSPEVMGKLEKAVSGAANKGSRDSLILMKDLAFIVNIPNRTVITAMDGESIKENVFTNIDSTVIAD